MWICPVCNELVPQPVNRRCPKGHGLFDQRILGNTKEVSFGASFRNALLACIGFAAAGALARFLLPAQTGFLGAHFLLVFIIAGIVGGLRALHWKRQGGAVERLVPRAWGMALGCIVAGVGLILIAGLIGSR